MIYEKTNEGDFMKVLLCSLFLAMLTYGSRAQAKPMFDLTFNLGPSLGQSGDIEKLGDPSLSTGFGFNYYFKLNHGIGFGYNNESSFDGSKDIRSLNDGSISTFDLHYAYRYIKGNFHIVFEPGIGRQTIYDQNSDYYWGYFYNDEISTAFLLNYKLFVRYIITQWESGDVTPDGYFFVGGGIIHNFTYDDDLNGQDISGNRLAALFQVGLGW